MKWVADALKETQQRLEALSAELYDDRSWKRQFQDALESQNKQIEKLLEGLREEKEARKEEDATIKKQLSGMGETFAIFKGAWFIFVLVITAVLSGLFGWLVPKIFEGRNQSPVSGISVPAPAPVPTPPASPNLAPPQTPPAAPPQPQ
jgi:hypothetical protein